MKPPRVNENIENGKLLHLHKETLSYFKACGITISLFPSHSFQYAIKLFKLVKPFWTASWLTDVWGLDMSDGEAYGDVNQNLGLVYKVNGNHRALNEAGHREIEF